MDAVIKRRWVEALRSGAYQQTKRALCFASSVGRAYCCLGVLCDITDPDGWAAELAPGASVPHRGSNDIPAGSVFRSSGLREHLCFRLAHMNDAGATFAQIADVIEQEIPSE